jgi:uncharacterized membrane protein YeaQ/YmgE (transglycosylase-associated protein family)
VITGLIVGGGEAVYYLLGGVVLAPQGWFAAEVGRSRAICVAEWKERSVTITGVISAIVIGLVIGALGRLVVPGRQPIPIWLTIVIGIIAAFIGAFIAGALGYANANGGIPWVLLIIQIVIAAIGVVIAANLYARRGGARP